jgi:hypothetical protein
MILKGCQPCGGDLWPELDMVSRLEELVCIQCGRRQAIQSAPVGRKSVQRDTPARSPVLARRSKYAV